MSYKAKKREEKYRVKQQAANKFKQKDKSGFLETSDEDAVRKIVKKICK